MFIHHAMLGKCCEYRIQIRRRPFSPFLFPKFHEESCYLWPFVYKTADVALALSQANGLREGREGLMLLVKHPVGQNLQDLHLDDVAPAFLLLRTGLQRLQERKSLSGHLLSQ